jgi:hypothetical protein
VGVPRLCLFFRSLARLDSCFFSVAEEEETEERHEVVDKDGVTEEDEDEVEGGDEEAEGRDGLLGVCATTRVPLVLEGISMIAFVLAGVVVGRGLVVVIEVAGDGKDLTCGCGSVVVLMGFVFFTVVFSLLTSSCPFSFATGVITGEGDEIFALLGCFGGFSCVVGFSLGASVLAFFAFFSCCN